MPRLNNYAVARWLKERVVSHEVGDHNIKLGVYRGIAMRVSPHNSLQLLYGLWERETYPFIRKALDAAWMIDVGAGNGEMAVLFARGGKATPIYAAEPDPTFVDKTKATLKRNRVATKAVTVIPNCIGTGPGHVTLDSLKTRAGRGFIKIDVDGGEVDVLESGRAMLAAQRPMILIETHSTELEIGCITLLEDLGYKTSIIKNGWWRRLVPERRWWSDHNRWLWAE